MIATIITTGDTQMVCLPKEIHVKNTQLYVYLEGEQVILSPHPKEWKDRFENPVQVEPFDFKTALLAMPNIGEDDDFARVTDMGREIELFN